MMLKECESDAMRETAQRGGCILKTISSARSLPEPSSLPCVYQTRCLCCCHRFHRKLYRGETNAANYTTAYHHKSHNAPMVYSAHSVHVSHPAFAEIVRRCRRIRETWWIANVEDSVSRTRIEVTVHRSFCESQFYPIRTVNKACCANDGWLERSLR